MNTEELHEAMKWLITCKVCLDEFEDDHSGDRLCHRCLTTIEETGEDYYGNR